MHTAAHHGPGVNFLHNEVDLLENVVDSIWACWAQVTKYAENRHSAIY